MIIANAHEQRGHRDFVKKLIFSPAAAIGLTAGIFLLDFFTYPGRGDWILYLASPWLLYQSPHRRSLIAISVACTVLMFLALFLSLPGTLLRMALLDRFIGAVMLWMTTAFLWRLTQKEDALRESEAKFRDLVEKANDLFWEVDRNGMYMYCSPNVVSILGYAQEEFLGKAPFDFMPPEEAQRVGSLFGAIVAEQKSFSLLTHEIRYKDGRLGTMECSGTPVFNQQGQLIGYRGVDRDITGRVTLEDQLRQAQKMEAIGQLASGVAHDFNNLLTVINGYSDLSLATLPVDDPLRENIAQVKQAGERAVVLTRQLLAFSRKQVLEPKVLDLNAVVTNIETMLTRTIGEDITLTATLTPALGRVRADPGQIEQVILNLVVNARDAMVQGGKLTIETANVELDENFARKYAVAVQPGHYVMLAVSDTGCGMDAETQKHIFEPFFTTKAQGKGTGLGLAMVYGIVKQSGGSIWVYSEVGKGTTFKVYLPRVEEEPDAVLPGAVRAASLKGTETILLVEDDEPIRNLTFSILRHGGYDVLAASSREEAIQLCGQHQGPIHLMLTDVVMPGRSVREFTEQLASTRPAMKVLHMSGYTDDTIVRHGVLEQTVAFLQKPFTTHSLLRKVREVLDAPQNRSGFAFS